MKETMNKYMFRDRFMQSDTYRNQFSYEGCHALFEYLEDYEDDCGEEIEFDMVGICCDYSEYDSLKDFNADYSNYEDGFTLDDIREETVVIEIPETERFIVGAF
jgi:hypothetical protein